MRLTIALEVDHVDGPRVHDDDVAAWFLARVEGMRIQTHTRVGDHTELCTYDVVEASLITEDTNG